VYNLAFTASRGVNYGFAAAITIIIFLSLARLPSSSSAIPACGRRSVKMSNPRFHSNFALLPVCKSGSVGLRLFLAVFLIIFSMFPILWVISASLNPTGHWLPKH
jgi:hypothetical protein